MPGKKKGEPKNKQLADALRTMLQPDTLAKTDAQAALDAIIEANHTNARQFRQAIFGHRKFWNTLGLNLTDKMSVASPNVFKHNFEGCPFDHIHKLAVTQRVKLGLRDADEDTLVGILGAQNENECRAYIQSKQYLGDRPLVAESQSVPSAASSKALVLPDEMISLIKDEAKKLLTLKFLQSIKGQDNMESKLQKIDQVTKGFNKIKKKMEFLKDINDFHLFSLSFQSKARDTAFKASYQARAQECKGILNQLIRFELILNPYNEGVITKDKVPLFYKFKERRDLLLDKVRKDIESFKDIQSGIEKVINGIDAAKTNPKHLSYVGVDTKIKTQVVDASSIPAVSTEIDEYSSGKEKSKHAVFSIKKQNDTHGFLIQEKIPPGQIKVFDVAFEDVSDKNTGRFTEEHSSPAMNSGRDSNFEGKYEIRKFPKDPRARVNFAMMMTAETLANLGGLPTKEKPLYLSGDNHEELRHLWAALKAHKVPDNAIKIQGTFNPNQKISLNPFNSLGKHFLKGFNAHLQDPSIKGHMDEIKKQFKENKELDTKLNKLSKEEIVNLRKQEVAEKKSDPPPDSAPEVGGPK